MPILTHDNPLYPTLATKSTCYVSQFHEAFGPDAEVPNTWRLTVMRGDGAIKVLDILPDPPPPPPREFRPVGAPINPQSERQTQPWLAWGWSLGTWQNLKRDGLLETLGEWCLEPSQENGALVLRVREAAHLLRMDALGLWRLVRGTLGTDTP